MNNALIKVRSIADYQFGRNIGKILFPENVEIVYSKATGRIRFVNLNGKRLATLRPTDGLFSISLQTAKILVKKRDVVFCFVKVKNEVSEFIESGRDVFAVHIVDANKEIRAQSEVIVLGEDNKVLAVGRALLSGPEMLAFKKGVAVKVRHGMKES
jgi:uncharacterized protein with predicted RNA binding PUA domain